MSFAYYPIRGPVAGGSSGSNWSYESGSTGWTPTAPATTDNFIVIAAGYGITAYHGVNVCIFDTFRNRVQTGELINADTFAAAVGESWTSTCRIIAQAVGASAYGAALIQFLTAADVVIGTSYIGSQVPGNGGGTSPPWVVSTVTATAPATTAKVRIGWKASNTDPDYVGRIHADWHTLVKN